MWANLRVISHQQPDVDTKSTRLVGTSVCRNLTNIFSVVNYKATFVHSPSQQITFLIFKVSVSYVSHTLCHRLPPRLFALIIGINEYESPNIPKLLGAVPDADAVRDYLQERLGVPSPQIRNLRNSEATRAAIIDGIEAFSLNDEIKEGDPILIYYAGHGGSADIPKGWEIGSTDKIELLIPFDHSSSLKDRNPKHGIPDRTLGVLLSQLAIQKGDNIVCQTFTFYQPWLTTCSRLSSSIVVTPVLAHGIIRTPPSWLGASISEILFLLILIERFGLTLSPRRFQDAEQRSMLALPTAVWGLMSFWQHVAPKSLPLSGKAEDYLRRDCSTPLWPLKSTSSRTPAYSNGCHVYLAGESDAADSFFNGKVTHTFHKAKPAMWGRKSKPSHF